MLAHSNATDNRMRVPGWLTGAQIMVPLIGPDKTPLRFRLRWRGISFHIRLAQQANGLDLSLYGVLGRIPYSAESITARSHWKGAIHALLAKPTIREFLALGHDGLITARFETDLGQQNDPSALIKTITLCLLQLAPSMDVINELRQSKRLQRLINAQAPPAPDRDRSDWGL